VTTTRHHEELAWPARRRQLQPTLEELVPEAIARHQAARQPAARRTGRRRVPPVRAVHRIDRETSGEARAGIEKRYLAITWGVPELGGERSCRLERNVELDPHHATGVRMRVVPDGQGLWAATRFAVQGDRRSLEGRSYALVRCDLETGRQHQIRLHLASLGFPIVGDKLYGPDDALFAKSVDGELTHEEAELLELPRHALHAWQLELAHPVTGEPLVLEAPMPRDMSDFWASLVP